MVSRSLEKMMLIAVGLSTVVIVGVPVLMYAIETVNMTSGIYEFRIAGEQIINATILVDRGYTNSTTITVWMNPNVIVSAGGYQLMIQYGSDELYSMHLTERFFHDVVIDYPFVASSITAQYSVEIVLVDEVIHISFFAFPV